MRFTGNYDELYELFFGMKVPLDAQRGLDLIIAHAHKFRIGGRLCHQRLDITENAVVAKLQVLRFGLEDSGHWEMISFTIPSDGRCPSREDMEKIEALRRGGFVGKDPWAFFHAMGSRDRQSAGNAAKYVR